MIFKVKKHFVADNLVFLFLFFSICHYLSALPCGASPILVSLSLLRLGLPAALIILLLLASSDILTCQSLLLL